MSTVGHFEFGFVSKVHGLKGDVTVQIVQPANKPTQKLDMFFVQQKGQLVPFFIASVSILGNQAIIKFEEVDSQAKALALKGCKLFLPDKLKPKVDKDEVLLSNFTGYKVVDSQLGELGIIQETYEIANNPLMEMNYKGIEILIPFQPNLLVGIDTTAKIIKMDLPEGLLDIYTNTSHTKDDGD